MIIFMSSEFVNAEKKVQKSRCIYNDNWNTSLIDTETVNYIKANQVLTKEKTGVPRGILWGQGRDAMGFDITATALALFLALIFTDIAVLIQTFRTWARCTIQSGLWTCECWKVRFKKPLDL